MVNQSNKILNTNITKLVNQTYQYGFSTSNWKVWFTFNLYLFSNLLVVHLKYCYKDVHSWQLHWPDCQPSLMTLLLVSAAASRKQTAAWRDLILETDKTSARFINVQSIYTPSLTMREKRVYFIISSSLFQRKCACLQK